MTSELTLLDGAIPLNEAQVEELVCLVLQRLEQKQRDQHHSKEATAIRRRATRASRAEL